MNLIHLVVGLIVCLSSTLIETQVRAHGHVFTTQDLEKPTRRSLSRIGSMTETLTGGFGSGLPPLYPSIKVKAAFDDDDDDQFYKQELYAYKRLMLDGSNKAALERLNRLLLESAIDPVSEKMLELLFDRAMILHRLGMNLDALDNARDAQSVANTIGKATDRIDSLVSTITKKLDPDH